MGAGALNCDHNCFSDCDRPGSIMHMMMIDPIVQVGKKQTHEAHMYRHFGCCINGLVWYAIPVFSGAFTYAVPEPAMYAIPERKDRAVGSQHKAVRHASRDGDHRQHEPAQRLPVGSVVLLLTVPGVAGGARRCAAGAPFVADRAPRCPLRAGRRGRRRLRQLRARARRRDQAAPVEPPQQLITIQQAQPDVVYVPSYNPQRPLGPLHAAPWPCAN